MLKLIFTVISLMWAVCIGFAQTNKPEGSTVTTQIRVRIFQFSFINLFENTAREIDSNLIPEYKEKIQSNASVNVVSNQDWTVHVKTEHIELPPQTQNQRNYMIKLIYTTTPI